MAFNKEPLKTLMDRSCDSYMSRLKPLDGTPRRNIIKVLAECEAGTYHQLQGDLSFLAEQLFPDTAAGEWLRARWSGRVPARLPAAARGTVRQTGLQGSAVPAGAVCMSGNGKRCFSSDRRTVGGDGVALVPVTASEPGAGSNMDGGAELSIVSSMTSGLDRAAAADAAGIGGGVDGESDEEYRARVIAYERGAVLYGKAGDVAAWAAASSSEVSRAFEIKNFGAFGALLVQVMGGSQFEGARRVRDLDAVRPHIESRAPPMLFTVMTPDFIEARPSVRLAAGEDTVSNRALAVERMRAYMDAKAAPGVTITQDGLRTAVADGVTISSAEVSLPGGAVAATVLQYPVIGEVSWE